MNTDAILSGIVLVLLVLVAVLCHHASRARASAERLDEDIHAPSVAVIDDALRRVGRDNRDGIDWLLDRRLAAAKEGATWPSI